MELKHITRGNLSPTGKPQVYFTGHPQDYAAFLESIAGDILASQNCAIYYDSQPEAAWDEETLFGELEQMKLFVIPVTRRFLCEKNRALEVEFPFALRHHIPVLPLAQEAGLEALFNQRCGDLQLLGRSDVIRDEKLLAGKVLSYEEKLQKRLSSILVGDELAEKIRAAFDAYIFLSYRKKDRAYAQELMRLIHKNDFCRDIAIWYDEFLNPGENFSDAIALALEKCSLFTMAVTPSLLEENNYVMVQEYPKARESDKLILPVELTPTDKNALQKKYAGLPVCVNARNEKALSAALLEKLREIAVQENDSGPQHNFFIGLAYLSGIDVEVDHQRAVSLITGAAEAGLTEAAKKLVDMYRTGNGVALDYQEAIRWQKHLVSQMQKCLEENGDPHTAYQLAHQQRILGDYCMELPDLAGAHDAYTRSLDICLSIIETSRRATADLQEASDTNPTEEDVGRFYTMTMWIQTGKAAEMMLPDYYDNLGDVFSALGQLEDAGRCYKSSLSINRRAFEEQGNEDNLHNLIISLQRLGDLCQKTGDDAGAHEYYQELEALCESGGRRRDTLVMYSKRGDECSMQSDWKQAEEYYVKQCRLAEELYTELRTDESREDLSSSYGRMAKVCWSTGRLKEAEEYTRKNLAVCTEWYEHSQSWYARYGVARTYHHMGIIFQLMEELDAAAENYLNALLICRQLYAQSQTKQVLNTIAENDHLLMGILMDQGRFKDARSCGIEMYDACAETGNETYMNLALSNLFLLAVSWCQRSHELIDSGRFEEALDVLSDTRELGKYISDKGRTIYDEKGAAINMRPLAAAIQNNLAAAHIQLGHFEQAVQAAYRSGDLYEKLFQETGEQDFGDSAVRCREFLGVEYLKRNNFELADYYLRLALDLRWTLFEQTQNIDHLPVLAQYCTRLGNIGLAQQKWKEAADHFYRASGLLTEHYKKTADVSDLALNCLATLGLGDTSWNLQNYKDAKVHYEDTLGCAIMVGKTADFPLTPAEIGRIYQRLAAICDGEGNLRDAMAYYEGAYGQWKDAVSGCDSEVNRDGFAYAAYSLGVKRGDAELLREAFDQWDLLCVQYPDNRAYRQSRQMAEEAMLS